MFDGVLRTSDKNYREEIISELVTRTRTSKTLVVEFCGLESTGSIVKYSKALRYTASSCTDLN